MLHTRLRVAMLVVVGVWLGHSTITSAHTDAHRAPSLAQEHGGKCVEDTEFMRRNHMNVILHQRDLTVHEGIRTSKYSLKECVRCHVEQQPGGSYIPINDPGQFCRSCHDYVGVQPDCFECHATTPTTPSNVKP